MNILKALYYGELIPFEHSPLNKEQYHKQVSQVSKDESSLLDGMTGEQKELYKKYYDSASKLHSEETCDFFVIGFRLGARMMLEILSEEGPV